MSADLFAVEGSTSDDLETYVNYPASPGHDSIIEISPDRGLFLRFLNQLQKAGGAVGMPVYLKLRDTNGDHIPANTSAYFALQVQGMEEPTKVSEKRGNLSFYLSNDITTQRDTDNIDGSLFVLTAPETDGSDPIPKLDVRDIDRLFFKIDSSAEVDWSQSEFYIDTAAVSEGSL
jgi:hypothetical protein